MVTKELAKKVIDALPDEESMDDIIHALYVKAKFDHGQQEIRQGRGIAHEEAKQRLQNGAQDWRP